MQDKDEDLLSIIVPVFNESDNLKPFVESLLAVMKQENYRFELIFVNDGSTDDSAKKLDAIAEREPCCKVVHFRRNFGQTAAFAVEAALPVVPDSCPACFEMPTQRQHMKELLAAEQARNPGLFKSLLTTLKPLMAADYYQRDHRQETKSGDSAAQITTLRKARSSQSQQPMPHELIS